MGVDIFPTQPKLYLSFVFKTLRKYVAEHIETVLIPLSYQQELSKSLCITNYLHEIWQRTSFLQIYTIFQDFLDKKGESNGLPG